ncbi:type II secretion system protein [Catenovulum sp. SM1970]|uniref:type IV pilus modification PilV family protein n=1 Tax=Marinifaba aquimaris TaxID=2741323 RepID=UPI0015745D85|nr:type II secretion system protein [Marinifaba aquimaris]NTS75868.1 type II secretion system protein [Marinifaba aquimaris]
MAVATMVKSKQQGFTLIELIIGIVTVSIALTIIVQVIIPQATRSVDPIFQVRAAELGQTLLEEVSAKSFDETSTQILGSARCGETGLGAGACTTIPTACPSSGLTSATEEANRVDFDDVDDYHCLTLQGESLTLGDGSTLNDVYTNFSARFVVTYDENLDGSSASSVELAKRITVFIQPPAGAEIAFSVYRFNY